MYIYVYIYIYIYIYNVERAMIESSLVGEFDGTIPARV